MRWKPILIVLAVIVTNACALTGTAGAQGSTQFSVVALDSDTFVTVQETGTGDMLSLYAVRGDRIYLVDTVFNSTSREIKLPRRFLHHLEVENR